MEAISLEKVTLFYGNSSLLFKERMLLHLSPDELQKANDIQIDNDKINFITTRYYLRSLLSPILQLEPKQIQFEYGVNGKPFLKDSKCYFNLSHSENSFVIAITGLGMIGVDIENKERQIAFEKLKHLIMSPDEITLFDSIDENDKRETFLTCWTRKEAFFKANGTGLTSPLKELNVEFRVNSKPRIIATPWSSDEKKEWSMFNITKLDNMIGTIAVKSFENIQNIAYFDISNMNY